VSRIRNIAPLVLALFALVAFPTTSTAGSHPNRNKIIKDCVDDGKIDGHYSRSDLNDAQRHLPTDVNEYTDCKAAIARALAGMSPGGGGGAGGPAGGGPPANPALATPSGAQAGSPADLKALRAASGGGTPRPNVSVGGHMVSPATGGLTRVADAANSLPGPVVAALIAVIVLCLAGSLAAVWRRWPELRRAPLGLLRR